MIEGMKMKSDFLVACNALLLDDGSAIHAACIKATSVCMTRVAFNDK
jgi:hypothetical protein